MRYPTPRVKLRELRGPELAKVLQTIPEWEAQESEVVGQDYRTGVALHRAYEFASFEDAVAFMAEASRHASRLDHHPRWENIWVTVTVWLSTWDIGYRISPLDVDLARAFDETRTHFPPPRPRQTETKQFIVTESGTGITSGGMRARYFVGSRIAVPRPS